MSGSTPTSSGASVVLTQKGDIVGFDTARKRIAVGSNDQVLTADSTTGDGIAWKTAGGGATITNSRIDGTGTFSTSSNSYVDVTDVTITLTNVAGGSFVAGSNISFGNSAAGNTFFQMEHGGNVLAKNKQEILSTETGQGRTSNLTIVGDTDGGIVKVTCRVSAGTVSCSNYNSSLAIMQVS
jgi:hypothetical protein